MRLRDYESRRETWETWETWEGESASMVDV